MAEGDRVLGWLAILNHTCGGEFGTVEASLVNSIGAILGIHSSNRDLYRQQAEFLASVVRALTSAIDAKDPYTCGHSDRVARIAVRLAKELGCDSEDAAHDLHGRPVARHRQDRHRRRRAPQAGQAHRSRIRPHQAAPGAGLPHPGRYQQLADVLPAVLHHHEQWDGKGYPFKLAGEQIPLIARILAVADAYDAMSSDRPYRRGMPRRAGRGAVPRRRRPAVGRRGHQGLFHRPRRHPQIAQEERANLTLDVQQWT